MHIFNANQRANWSTLIFKISQFFSFFLTNIFFCHFLTERRQELVRKIFTDYKQRQRLDKQRGGGCKSVEGR